MTAVIITMVV